MSLMPEVNREKTIENAKNVLLGYLGLKRISGMDFEQKVTATYSFEPRSNTGAVSNPIEKHIVRQVTALKIVEDIEKAINKITDVNHRVILFEKYCKTKDKDVVIMSKINIYDSEFYRELDKALLWFSELYNNGELLVFDDCGYFGSKLKVSC